VCKNIPHVDVSLKNTGDVPEPFKKSTSTNNNASSRIQASGGGDELFLSALKCSYLALQLHTSLEPLACSHSALEAPCYSGQ
jgi:hypothetical protein